MKKLIYSCFLIVIFFTVSSCEENGIFFPTTKIEKGNFSVTLDGSTTFSTQEVSYTTDDKIIYINAINPQTNEVFSIKVDNFDVGSFSFQGTNTVASFIKNDAASADIWTTSSQTSSRGTIDFTSIDFVNNRVSGSFNFIGKNSVTGSSRAFTQGVFLDIPKSTVLISNDSFSAKLDGIEYEEISLFTNLVTVANKELILINANKSLTETITITLESSIEVGEYNLGSFINQTYPTAQYNLNNGVYLGDGKVIITSHDKSARLITGTFQFNASPITSASPSFSITNGAFSVTY